MIEHQIDCIVRFHDPSRLRELNNCIFSLVGQTYRPLNIIIVLQKFTAEQTNDVRASLAPLMGLPGAPTLKLENLSVPEAADARTELLNFGLSLAQGQYVAFLDYDDVLYPEAYEILARHIQTSGAAIAFASVRPVLVDVWPQFIHTAGTLPPFRGKDLTDLFRGNFCPIHSYLIDRSIVGPEMLSFDTRLTWEEDYDLLLRICATWPSDFGALGIMIGDYYYKTDGSNSVAVGGGLSAERMKEYELVSASIEARRCSTFLSPYVKQQLGFKPDAPDMTIRDFLTSLDNKNQTPPAKFTWRGLAARLFRKGAT